MKDIAGYSGSIPVAVKTLTSRDPEVVKKFYEEAELMKKFSHPNIISLLGKWVDIHGIYCAIPEFKSLLPILDYSITIEWYWPLPLVMHSTQKWFQGKWVEMLCGVGLNGYDRQRVIGPADVIEKKINTVLDRDIWEVS